MYAGSNRSLKAEPINDNDYKDEIEPIPLLFTQESIKSEDPAMGYDLSLQGISSNSAIAMDTEPVPSTSSTALAGTSGLPLDTDSTQKHEPELNINEDEELEDDNDSEDFSTDADDDNRAVVDPTPVYDHQAFPPEEVS